MMDHPNIAKVLDAGPTPNGRPYFVMELVNGLPLTEYCDQHQLSTRERLHLFVAICRGIQHAHQKGVIHRDLKPSNILVAEYDETAVPKIIDFGVAKAVSQQLTEKTLFTELGQIIGTLEYMSPEQAKRNQLDIDTRSDIYSLGIILYCLLTGETPFSTRQLRDAAWDEILRVIHEEEPLRPSAKLTSSEQLAEVASKRRVEPAKLTALVRGDLDWIVMKALQKERAARYASANELGEDVQRHLEMRPIVARPPSLLDLTRKFVRRNSVAVVASLIVSILCIGGSVGYLQWRKASMVREEVQLREQKKLRTEKLSSTLEDASFALGKAIATPVGQKAEWLAVAAHENRLLELLDEGEAEQEVTDRANSLLADVENAKQDRQLAELLEDVVLGGATQMTLESWQKMERRIRELFLDNGMDLENESPQEIAKRIREHQFASRLVDALELWLGTKGQLSAFPGGPALTAEEMEPWAQAMYAADTDPLRSAVRKQIYSRELNVVALEEVVEQRNVSTTLRQLFDST